MTFANMLRAVHYQDVDPGTQWIKDADIAIDSNGPLDADRTLTPNVVKMDGGYRMYYHGLGPERPNAASKGYILSAFSTDAEHWEKEPGVRMDAGGEGAEHYIWSPDVIPLADGRYRMYYEGKTETGDGQVKATIVSAVSADGLVWEREPGLRLAGASVSYLAPRCLHLDPAAEQGGPRFRLYVSAYPYPDVSLARRFQQQKHRQRRVRRWSSVRAGARRSHTPRPSSRILCRLCPGGFAPRRGRLSDVLRRLDVGSRGPPWIKVSRQNLQRIFRGRSAVGQGSGNLH